MADLATSLSLATPEAQAQSAFDAIADSEIPALQTGGLTPEDGIKELEDLIDGMISGKLGASTSETCIRVVVLASISKAHRAPILALKGAAARRVLDIYQKVHSFCFAHRKPGADQRAFYQWLDNTPEDHFARRSIVYLVVKLAAHSNQLPASLFLEDVMLDSLDSHSQGGFADVFSGYFGGHQVAIKRPRGLSPQEKASFYPVRSQSNKDVHKFTCTSQRFCREALIWRQLRHDNVLPFTGIDADTFRVSDLQAMVSPWMSNGTITDFIHSDKYDPHQDCNRLVRYFLMA
jgi:hypothetical protein